MNRIFKLKLNNQIFYQYLFAFLCGMLGCLLVLFITSSIRPTARVATVNITVLVDQFIKNTSQKGLPDTELQNEVKQFGMKLDQTIKKLSQENNLVILPKEAVVSGATDYTKVISDYMQRIKMTGQAR